MKINTKDKTDSTEINRNQCETKAGLSVKTQVKSGGVDINHNQTVGKAA